MRIISKILCTALVIGSLGVYITNADELNKNYVENTTINTELKVNTDGTGSPSNTNDMKLDTQNIEAGGTKAGVKRNPKLETLGLDTLGKDDGRLINVDATQSDGGVFNFLVRIAKGLKNVFFGIATVYFLIITIKLLFSENSEEEFGKFKKGILWITIGIMVMQLAYLLVTESQNQGISGGLANDLLQSIVMPLIKFIETAASFFFIAIAVFAFYRMVTSAGDEEKAKGGKMSVMYAIIGFIVIKISGLIVKTTYSETLCENGANQVDCTSGVSDISEGASIIFKVINWLNSFVGIAVVIMIIYAGVQIIFSNGDDEKVKKAKTSIIYIIVGIVILTLNYLILTFFLLDKTLT